MPPELNPLLDPPPAEVRLPDAPLIRVIAQVRFAEILSVQNPFFVAPFQEALRSKYPVLEQEDAQDVVLEPEGVAAARRRTTWRFRELDGAWRVSLAPDFVALETTNYTSRSDFLERLKVILQAAQEHLRPAVVQRLGMRYIDRVQGDDAQEIERLVRRELLAILATSLSSHVRHGMSEALFDVPGGSERLRMRWGRIPAHGTVDPRAIEPIAEPSFVLDLDMFSTEESPFSTEAISDDARRYAERLYALFRWAVTEEFLRRYGGRP